MTSIKTVLKNYYSTIELLQNIFIRMSNSCLPPSVVLKVKIKLKTVKN